MHVSQRKNDDVECSIRASSQALVKTCSDPIIIFLDAESTVSTSMSVLYGALYAMEDAGQLLRGRFKALRLAMMLHVCRWMCRGSATGGRMDREIEWGKHEISIKHLESYCIMDGSNFRVLSCQAYLTTGSN